MDKLTLTGKVVAVGATTDIPTRSGANFQKRVLELDITRTDPATGIRGYENIVGIEFTQSRCVLLDAVAPGDMVIVNIAINGRRNGERIFNSVCGFRVEKISAPTAAPAPTPTPTAAPTNLFPGYQPQSSLPKENNGLPF